MSVYSWVSPATAASRLSARVADRQAGGRVADLLQVVQVAVRVAGLALGGVAEQAGDIGIALDVGLLGEVEIAAVRLRFAGERVFQVLVGLGPFECCHSFISLEWRYCNKPTSLSRISNAGVSELDADRPVEVAGVWRAYYRGARQCPPWLKSSLKTRAKANSGSAWTTSASAVSPAATAVPSSRDSRASARSASTPAAGCTSPGATSPACSATPSRRSRSSTSCPGALALSFGMLGCDLHCGYCQNWVTSQALRDPQAVASRRRAITPEASGRRGASSAAPTADRQHLQRAAHHRRVGAWRSSRQAKAAGPADRLRVERQRHAGGARVPAPLARPLQGRPEELRRPALPRAGRARCEPSSTPSGRIHEMGFWVEVVTLVVPGFNDSDRGAAARWPSFLAGVSPDIPWHVTAFHPDYKMTGPRDTRPTTCCGPPRSAARAGLRYVYAGQPAGRRRRASRTRAAPAAARR